MELLTNPIFALFTIISLGFVLGSVSVKGISFDVSAVIFVALVFGHYGIIIPTVVERVGMVIFIFTVGIQAGPGFLDSFRKYGRQLAFLSFIIVFTGALLAFVFMLVFKIPPPLAVGLLCGALTSTPGLTVAIDSTASSLASIGYGIAYPFGVIGVILFVKLIPRVLGVNLVTENTKIENEEMASFPSIQGAFFVVENSSIFGKSLKELKVRSMTGASISRVKQGEKCSIPTPETMLQEGDIIKAVGTEEALQKVKTLIGSEANSEIVLGDDYVVEQLLVTNKKLVNKRLGDLALLQSYGSVVTRIRRSGIDISPSPDIPIRFGDKFTVACPKENLKPLSKLLGNNDKILSDTDFLPIALGIVLGFVLGQVQVSFSNHLTVGLGLSGGILLMAIILSGLGRTGPIVWTMSGSANQLLRQLGLLLFLAGVGTHAGEHLMATLKESGMQLFLLGLAITLVPMFVAGLLNKLYFKLNLFELLGTITGGMTSTPGLAACDSLTRSNAPGKAYAAVYPIAMVILIIFVQIISRVTL